MIMLVGYRDTDRNLLPLVMKHAKAFGGKVIVATSLVGEENDEPEKIIEVEQALDFAKSFFEDESIQCETFALSRESTHAEALLSFAKEKGAEQIFIGAKSRSKVGKLIFGSTVQSLILKSPWPVTVLPRS